MNRVKSLCGFFRYPHEPHAHYFKPRIGDMLYNLSLDLFFQAVRLQYCKCSLFQLVSFIRNLVLNTRENFRTVVMSNVFSNPECSGRHELKINPPHPPFPACGGVNSKGDKLYS